jgi:5-methylcytosine-specific restriction endonuclease McrBC GTP-binding regulatory subunit McrB
VLEFTRPIHQRLDQEFQKALQRPADLIDVHSLLWVNLRPGQLSTKAPEPAAVAAIPAELAVIWDIASRTRNIIFYGPPGTGKTWLVNHFATYFLLFHNVSPTEAEKYWQAVATNDDTLQRTLKAAVRAYPASDYQQPGSYIDTITFHQSYAYEEFVEGLRPFEPDEDHPQVWYGIKDGIFKRVCARAAAAWQAQGDQAPKYILVIDEINRANIAKVFGELITLLEDDKRLGQPNALQVSLPYSGLQGFGIPPNLYLLGTMNTADRSIALLDIALRRRFAFVEVMPQPGLLKTVEGINLNKVLDALNQKISALLDPDHQIGHSYLMGVSDIHALRFAWYYRIIPLLQEYFYNDDARLQVMLGEKFVIPAPPGKAALKALGDLYDTEDGRCQIQSLHGEAFALALKELEA